MLAKRTWARMAPAGAEQVSKAKLALRIGPPAVREIILEVGLPLKTSEARLLIALRKAHDAAAVATAMDAGPTEAQTFDHLADVRTTAKGLASLLGVNEGRDIRDSQLPTFNAFCREAPAEDVLAVVAGVERLARWADNLKRQRPKKTPRIAVGTMLAVAMLPKIYEKHFDRKFGLTTTRKDEKSVAGGPALRFVVAALSAMGRKTSPAAVAKARRRRNGRRPLFLPSRES